MKKYGATRTSEQQQNHDENNFFTLFIIMLATGMSIVGFMG